MRSTPRYQIFISSTFQDLEVQRKALIHQILKEGHTPSGMELFCAGDENEFQVIKEAIDQSDLCVVLIGANYGSIKEGTNPPKSYTELEFLYARDVAKKPCIVFLLNEEEFDRERKKIESENTKESGNGEKLRAFRVDAPRNRIAETFSLKDNPYKLVLDFQTAFKKWTPEPDVGYVPVTEVLGIKKLVSLLGTVGQTEIMIDILGQLNKYDRLVHRMSEGPHLKRGLSTYFWKRFAAQIFNAGYRNLYFESGSTLAYLSSELLPLLERNAATLLTTPILENRIRIRTNNILTYLSYILLSRAKTSLVPYGPPDTKYGATYGDIVLHVGDEVAPDPSAIRMNDIGRVERKLVTQICRKALGGGNPPPKKWLFLSAASGLELTHRDSLCQGPHVGSYSNMLLKRAIYETGSPVILFVDDTKIDRNFVPAKCYSVMTKAMTWQKVCVERPIAVCYASSSAETYSATREKLQRFGLSSADEQPEVIPTQGAGSAYCGLFGNSRFYACMNETDTNERARKRVLREAIGPIQ